MGRGKAKAVCGVVATTGNEVNLDDTEEGSAAKPKPKKGGGRGAMKGHASKASAANAKTKSTLARNFPYDDFHCKVKEDENGKTLENRLFDYYMELKSGHSIEQWFLDRLQKGFSGQQGHIQTIRQATFVDRISGKKLPPEGGDT